MEMKDILDIDMGFEDEQLTLYLENIKGKNEDDFNLMSATKTVNINENLSLNQRGSYTAVPSIRTSPMKG